jgi:hypothetical protein
MKLHLIFENKSVYPDLEYRPMTFRRTIWEVEGKGGNFKEKEIKMKDKGKMTVKRGKRMQKELNKRTKCAWGEPYIVRTYTGRGENIIFEQGAGKTHKGLYLLGEKSWPGACWPSPPQKVSWCCAPRNSCSGPPSPPPPAAT